MPLTKRFRFDYKTASLLTVGLILITLSFFWRIHRSSILSFRGNYSNLQKESEIHNNPVKIIIPSRNIDLTITESQIIDGVWQISDAGASHLAISSDPGSGGNIVIYAHNKKSLFGPIRWMGKDELINIIDEKNEGHSYKVMEIKEVIPENIEYVLPKGEETLTLYTCTGYFDTKRFIVIASPI